jgi:hypothetical protein
MKIRKTAATIGAIAALAVAGATAAAAPAFADYGPGNTYEVEISSNLTGPQGGGVWLWLALSPNPGSTSSGTGDYSGADCGHGIGAVSDKGQVTWAAAGGTITIQGVVLNGLGGLPVTITVHSAYGHYSTDVDSVIPTLGTVLGLPPGAGFSQVTIAR